MIKKAQFFFAHEIDIVSAKNLCFSHVAPRTKSKELLIDDPLLSKNS
jgi:hypothetical protein